MAEYNVVHALQLSLMLACSFDSLVLNDTGAVPEKN